MTRCPAIAMAIVRNIRRMRSARGHVSNIRTRFHTARTTRELRALAVAAATATSTIDAIRLSPTIRPA
jgi:hypothetical protein